MISRKSIREQYSVVHVMVYDHTGKKLTIAQLTLERCESSSEQNYGFKLDSRYGYYTARDIPTGRYLLSAKAAGYQDDQRTVQVDPAGLNTVMILGADEWPFLYRGEVKTPFQNLNMVAVVLSPDAGHDITAMVVTTANETGLTVEKLKGPVSSHNVLVFRYPEVLADNVHVKISQKLHGVPGIRAVVPLIRFTENSLSMLTNELVVKFLPCVTIEEISKIGNKYGMERLRRVPQAGNAYLFRLPGVVTFEMLKVAPKLLESGLVEYAEPNLLCTMKDHAFNSPTDFLFPLQWNLKKIHCLAAWKAIDRWQKTKKKKSSSSKRPDLTFGSPEILIAVLDDGIDVKNPDFRGKVSNGTRKVRRTYDFVTMKKGVQNPSNDHGTCCAGIATAKSSNNDGIVGVAANCRLMALRAPFSGGGGTKNACVTELEYSDIYYWMGGFNPESRTLGFPDPISPGADVISTSWMGISQGLQICGHMKDTFNKLTTLGRGGRGVLLFFSVGNDGDDFSLSSPWAASDRTLAVAASSVNGGQETRAGYSNWGGGGGKILDFCAPSSFTKDNDTFNPLPGSGIITTTAPNAQDDVPDLLSRVHAKTTITIAHSSTGAKELFVKSVRGFRPGQFVIIGTPGSPNVESNMVDKVDSNPPHLILKSEVTGNHGRHTRVYGGISKVYSRFGGTSAAAPLAAGVGALLLSVNPELTWVQVRDFLRSTADKINPEDTTDEGRWEDKSGKRFGERGYDGSPYYSRGYGYGRINAVRAVQKAIRYADANRVS